MTNTQALQNLLTSTRYNIAQIDADLARLNPTTPDQMYHQGYQNGRRAELDKLVDLLELSLMAGAQ